RDADPGPADEGLVRAGGRTEMVDELALHRPFERAQARLGDGGQSGPDAAREGGAACPLQPRDDVVDAPLLPLVLAQAPLGLPHVPPGGGQVRFPLPGQVGVALQLAGPFGLAAGASWARIRSIVIWSIWMPRPPICRSSSFTIRLVASRWCSRLASSSTIECAWERSCSSSCSTVERSRRMSSRRR